MKKQPLFGDHYKIVWHEPRSIYRVGRVINYTTDGKGKREIPILLDDPLMIKSRMRFLVSSWDNKGPRISVSSSS